MTLPGVHWTFLMISSSNNLGLKMVEVHADLNPMCEGWYRKSFPTDPSWKGKRVVLDFGGIIYLGDVYLNGTKIASTDYGYVGLEADLTPFSTSRRRKRGSRLCLHRSQERLTLVHGRRSVP